MAWIDQHLEKFIKDCFPERYVCAYHEYRTWQSHRYLYVTTVLKDDKDLHYEYIGGAVELHLEGKYQSADYKYFAKELRFQTSRSPKLHWLGWQGRNQCRCRIDAATDNWEQLMNAFIEIMGIFDPIIEKIIRRTAVNPSVEPYKGDTVFSEEGLNDDEVCLATCSLGKLFGNNLVVPDYQRNYCWEDKQVKALWDSLMEIPHYGEYHLTRVRDNIQKSKEQKNIQPTKGDHKMVTCQNYVSLFYCQITSCPSDGGIS